MIFADTFIYSVLTSYALYQYLLTGNNAWKNITVLHLAWCFLYIGYALLMFHAGSTVQQKVSSIILLFILLDYVPSFVKGKGIAIISHKIINSCTNAHIDLPVIIIIKDNINLN